MQNLISNLDQWHKTRAGHIAFGLIELSVSYLLISRAIDTGSLWQYGLGIILAIGAFQNIVNAVRYRANGKR